MEHRGCGAEVFQQQTWQRSNPDGLVTGTVQGLNLRGMLAENRQALGSATYSGCEPWQTGAHRLYAALQRPAATVQLYRTAGPAGALLQRRSQGRPQRFQTRLERRWGQVNGAKTMVSQSRRWRVQQCLFYANGPCLLGWLPNDGPAPDRAR